MLINMAVAYHCIDVIQDPLHVLPLFRCFATFNYLKLKTYTITTHICRYLVKTYVITHICTIILFCFM